MTTPALTAEGPKPTRWTEAQISQVAEQVAKKLGFKPGDDIRKFAEEKLGATIVVDDWRQPAPSGMIEVRGPRNFTIWLSPYTAPLRDVFTIAHELGHYFLHSKIGLHPITVNREGSNLVEWEANAFAAAFLLPADEFEKSWEKHRHSIADVAVEFGVSTSVVRIRAERLGLPA
jgi:predicted transcriptional regulator